MLFAADAASQGLVIGVGAAVVAVLGLLATAFYKLLDNGREDIRALRGDLGEYVKALRTEVSTGFEKLRNEFNGINRELGELKVRLEYVGTTATEARETAREATVTVREATIGRAEGRLMGRVGDGESQRAGDRESAEPEAPPPEPAGR